MKDMNFIYQQIEEIRNLLKRTVQRDTYSLLMEDLSFIEHYLSVTTAAESCEYSSKTETQTKVPVQSRAEQQLFDIMATLINYGINIYALGEEWVREAESIYQFIKNVQDISGLDYHFERACICYNLGVLYIEHGRLEEAYTEFHEAAKIFCNTCNAPEIDEPFRTLSYYTFFNLALCCRKLTCYEESEENYKLAINVQQSLLNRDNVDFVQTIFQLEELYLDLKQTNKAEQLLLEMYPIIENLSDALNDIHYTYLLDWCEVMEQQGKYEDVLKTVQNCCSHMKAFPASPKLISQFLHVEYWAYLSLGQTDKCFEVLESLSLLTQIYPDKTAIKSKSIFKMQAELCDEQGKSEESIKYFQLAWEKYEQEKLRDVFWEISFLTNLSLAYIHGIYYQKAIETAHQCIELIESLALNQQDYNFTLAPIYTNLGLVYLRIMDPDQAEHYFFAALNLNQQRQLQDASNNDKINLFINLAWTYISKWQYEKAEHYAHLAKSLLTNDKNKYYIDICRILSIASANQNDIEDGIKWIDEAIKLEGASPSVSLCRNFCIKGSILRNINHPLAMEFHQKSLNLARELKLENTILYLEPLMDWLNSVPTAPEEAIDELKNTIQKISLPDSYLKLSVFSCIVMNSINLSHQADAFKYSAKAILLYEKLVKDAIQYKNPTTIINYKRCLRLFYEVIFLSLLNINVAERRLPEYAPFFNLFHYYKLGDFYLLNQRENSESSYRQLELELNYLNFTTNFLKARSNPEYTHKLLMKKADMDYWKAPDQESVQTSNASLPAEYRDFWCIDYYCPEFKLFVVAPCGFAIIWQCAEPKKKTLIVLENTDKIQKSVSKFRDAVIRDDSTQTQEQELYQLLIAPIMEQLPRLKSVHNFIICPDGPITTIPFEAVMGIHNRILYVPFTDILHAKKCSVSHHALVAGNPTITQHNALDIDTLQNSVKECRQVTKALRSAGYAVQTLYGDDPENNNTFSREALLHCLGTNRYTVVHLSTHGFYLAPSELSISCLYNIDSDNPYKRCGIVLNDETENNKYDFHRSIICGEDILKLDMSGTQLVVLSTCVSGLGHHASGEWLTGLQRAFLIAGTENIIVSLWEVDEEATILLMTYFYQHLAKKLPLDLALLEAKRELIQYQNGIYSTPFYWAGFIYIGKISVL